MVGPPKIMRHSMSRGKPCPPHSSCHRQRGSGFKMRAPSVAGVEVLLRKGAIVVEVLHGESVVGTWLLE
jgi:hypothetical protein